MKTSTRSSGTKHDDAHVDERLAATFLPDSNRRPRARWLCLWVQWLSHLTTSKTLQCQMQQQQGLMRGERQHWNSTLCEVTRFYLLRRTASEAQQRLVSQVTLQPCRATKKSPTHDFLSRVCNTLYCIPGSERRASGSGRKREKKKGILYVVWEVKCF